MVFKTSIVYFFTTLTSAKRFPSSGLSNLLFNCDIYYLSIYLSVCPFLNSCRRLPESKQHSSLFLHWSGSNFLVVMAACTPSINVFLGRPLSFSPVEKRTLHVSHRTPPHVVDSGTLTRYVEYRWNKIPVVDQNYHCYPAVWYRFIKGQRKKTLT